MTQEEKQLLIKDLCARLPYGVKVKNVKNNFDINIFNHNVEEIKFLIEEYNIKPYLRPMLSMTEEEKKEYDEISGQVKTFYGREAESHECAKLTDWLNAHHFDFRNLIEKGLAIDCTNLNIY